MFTVTWLAAGCGGGGNSQPMSDPPDASDQADAGGRDSGTKPGGHGGGGAGGKHSDPTEHDAGSPVTELGPLPLDTLFLRRPPATQSGGEASEFELTCNRSTCSFECSLDGANFSACSSPLVLRDLEPGSHELRARALSADDERDPSPAHFSFSVGQLYRSLASSMNASCAVTASGEIYCWGADNHGALLGQGVSTALRFPAPQRVGADSDYRRVVGGQSIMCGVKQSNEVWCWGYGQLFGDATLGMSSQLAPVRTQLPAALLSFGEEHGCAVDDQQHLQCWGDNGYNQLGLAELQEPVVAPRQVGDNTWKRVATGEYHTCAIASDGALYCFGDNSSGQSGQNPELELIATPTRVGARSDWTELSCSGDHCCALQKDHSLWCWGDNNSLQLGVGAQPMLAYEPRQVGESKTWTTVHATQRGGCASKSTGASYCWGQNDRAQLGSTALQANESPIPNRISLDVGIDQFASGYAYVCGLARGHLYCWGDNTYPDGALGRGVAGQESSLVKLDGGWAKLATRRNGGCGLRTDHTLACWGVGPHVVTTDVQFRLVPTAVDAHNDWTDLAISTTSEERGHACAVRAAEIYCWGRGDEGQLGTGGTGSQSAPVKLEVASVSFAQVSVGDFASCGLTSDGHLYCWGRNDLGQLGDGSTTRRLNAVAISTPAADGWSEVSLAGARTTARRSDGTLWAWGSNTHSAVMSTPTQLGSATNWVKVRSTTANSSCAINDSGELHCTVTAYAGTWPRALARVGDTTDYVDVFDAQSGVCGTKSDGSLACATWNGTGDAFVSATRKDWSVAEGALSPDWQALSGTTDVRCALAQSGDRYCSGTRFAGSFGDGVDERLPVEIPVPE